MDDDEIWRRRLPAVLLALGLLAAGCGSGSDDASSDEADGAQAAADSERDDSDGGGASGDDSAASDGDAADDGGDVAEAAFPSIEVTDVATGGTVDLATELGGGDTPVLLWFWAPH